MENIQKTTSARYKQHISNKQQEVLIPSIIKDDYLSRLFPHLGVPYIVWVTKSGTLLSLTRTNFLTAENLSHVIN